MDSHKVSLELDLGPMGVQEWLRRSRSSIDPASQTRHHLAMATPDPIPSNVLMQLREHVDFVTRSTDAYDEGHSSEAKRFAVSLRVLFYDAPPFRSVMLQADGLRGNFLSSAIPRGMAGIDRFGGIIRTARVDGRLIHFAPLDGPWYARWLPFVEWWNEPVFVDDASNELSRRDVVSNVAAKEGGANVDPMLSAVYEYLFERDSKGAVRGGGEAITNPERAAIRQIAHEVLRTLLPPYRKMSKLESDPRVAAAVIKANERPASLPFPPGYRRNDPCPCGSGKRLKHCHAAI